MTRVPPEHLTAGWYLALVVVAVSVLLAAGIWLRRWLPPPPPPPAPALTAEAVGAELQKVLKAYINGDLGAIKAQLALMDAKQDELGERVAWVEGVIERSPSVPHHARLRTPK